MRRLVIVILLVLTELWPTMLESDDLNPHHVQYPCVIMQCQDWHYVLEAPGGTIIKVATDGCQSFGVQPAEEIQV